MKKVSFLQFINEVTLDVDLSDPATAVSNVRHAARMQTRNPRHVTKNELMQSREKTKEIQQSDSPTKTLEIKIEKLRQQIARYEMQLAAMKQKLK